MKLARAGQRQAVLLSGEPGIGKTRLASFAAHDAHADGFAVVLGCVHRGARGALRAVDRCLLAARGASYRLSCSQGTSSATAESSRAWPATWSLA